MSADVRVPRWVLVVGWLACVLQVLNALSLRLAPETLPLATPLDAFAQSLADRVSSRDAVWAAVMAWALTGRRRGALGVLFVMRAGIETADLGTMAWRIARAELSGAAASFAPVVLALVAVYLLAARSLARSAEPR